MLEDLRTLLAAVPADAEAPDYREAVLVSNVLGKLSDSTRKKSYRYLRELYRLDPEATLFSALRVIWDHDPDGQPLLAMLCAMASDPVLRGTADVVRDTPIGAPFSNLEIRDAVLAQYPLAYSDSIAGKIGRNAGSSWTQSGHLQGRTNKHRTRAKATPGSTAYALYLGYLEGVRGSLLFTTDWARTLDAPIEDLYVLAAAASKYGWIDFKKFGDVVDVEMGDIAARARRIVSVIDQLAAKYADAVAAPWQQGYSGPERTWMLVYPPQDERRLRAKLEEFRIATQNAGHQWLEVDFTNEYERWLLSQDYLESFYENPNDLQMLQSLLGEHLTAVVEAKAPDATDDHVVALTGLGTLFGVYSVSALIEAASELLPGRILAFFPGTRDGNNYRLLDAKDGWNYLAVPIDLSEGSR